jgi:hypothetical protein
MNRFFRNNGLSLVLGMLFLVFCAGQASGHVSQATGENLESQFLKMGAYVMVTWFLFQKGSTESKHPERPNEGHASAAGRRQYDWIHRNSLSLGSHVLFLRSIIVHILGGLGRRECGTYRTSPARRSAGHLSFQFGFLDPDVPEMAGRGFWQCPQV